MTTQFPRTFATLLAAPCVLAGSLAQAGHADEWGPQQLVITGAGCPIESPDGLSLFIASGRSGGVGDLDIWTLDRLGLDQPWGVPQNMPEPVNSTAQDFCPTPLGRSLFFVSTRQGSETCGSGNGDIYLTRQNPATGEWRQPTHLPCAPNGPNTVGTERSPSLVETWYGTFLFFSTDGGVMGADDIFVSKLGADGTFGPGWPVKAVNSDVMDQMPTVVSYDNGTFEMTFNSNRTSWGPGGRGTVEGGQDVYSAKAIFLPFWWSSPRNLGKNVNTPANETRATISADGKRLYVGRGDVFVSERQR